MKLVYKFWGVLFAALFSVGVTAAQSSYVIDPGASSVLWTGSKVVGGSHNGTVKLKSGELVLKAGVLADGKFVADMTTLTVDDITGASAEKLGGHLVSEDFFGVTKYPTSSFDITKVTPGAGNAASVTGKLTIKGKTSEVAFPVTYSVMKNGQLEAKGTVTVDRTKHDIRYGSTSFVSDLGDRAISDEFTLEVKLVARRG